MSQAEATKALDVNFLKEIAVKGLVNALNAVNGAKTLVLDSSLAGPLGLVTEVALLKQHGVDKMFWLEPGPLSSTTSNVVYLCRPHIRHAKVIADQIKRHAKENLKHNYTVILVPRESTLVSQILEEEGVLGDVTITSYNLQFMPLAEDVISLENDKAFKELWVDGDETVVFDSAQALITFQKLYGQFPRIVGKGDYAAKLASLLNRQVTTDPSNSASEYLLSSSSRIDSVIVLDRKVDMITPLLTQLTYEGLIDELIGIKNSHVELPASLVTPPNAPAPNQPPSATTANTSATTLRKEAKKKHHLDPATDTLFARLRDLNFSLVGKKLNQVAHRLDEDYKARLQAKTVAQLREFVGKLGGLQNEHQTLRLHTGLSELLVPLTRTEQFNKSLEVQQNLLASYDANNQLTTIEGMIAQGAEMQEVIRLLCLACITVGGVKPKVLENIKREILQTYGYEHLPLLLSLSASPLSILYPTPSAGSSQGIKYPFTSLRKSLRLLIDDNPEALEEVENDISYVYSGFAPISIRLVQCVAQKGGVLSNPASEKEKNVAGDNKTRDSMLKVQAHPIVGWKGFEDVLGSIPGETVDIVQDTSSAISSIASAAVSREPSTTVVFFLGGCTYTEIAALRWVGRQNLGRRFLIATTGIISGANIVDSIAGIERGSRTAASI